MKKVNLFLVGAPKCGTTTLADILGQFDEIFLPSVKEPHHFEEIVNRGIKSRRAYEELYKKGSNSKFRLDASTGYLYCEKAIENIIKYNHEAKFIICLRDPLRMITSLHGHALRGGYEDVMDVNEAIRLINKRRMGESIPKRCVSPKLIDYVERCRIGFQCERVFRLVDSKNIHIVFLNDIMIRVDEVVSGISEWLGVGVERFVPKHSNASRSYRSQSFYYLVNWLGKVKRRAGFSRSLGMANLLASINSIPQKHSKLSDATTDLLRPIFDIEKEKIEFLIGRNESDIWSV
jgi:hypothetical protein